LPVWLHNHNYYFTAHFGLEENYPNALREILQNISRVCSEFLKRWIDARRNQQYFVSKNTEWLEQEINLHIKVIAKLNATDYEMPRTLGKRGCRKLAFDESSERSKRRKSKELQQTVGFPELIHATKISLRSAGKTDAAKLFSEVLEITPRALRIRKAWAAHAKNIVVPYTPEEALSLFIEAHLTKSQYTKIRSQAKMKNCTSTPVTT
jgi:hypothetical protein